MRSWAPTAPTVNTSGTAMQQIPLTTIPIGPLGVTARKVYRRFNLAGAFYLVATLADNTTDDLQRHAGQQRPRRRLHRREHGDRESHRVW